MPALIFFITASVSPFVVCSTQSRIPIMSGVAGQQILLEFHSILYARLSDDKERIQEKIVRQIRSAVGAIREHGITLYTYDANCIKGRVKWTEERFSLESYPEGLNDNVIRKVTYHYVATGFIASLSLQDEMIETHLLANDYDPYIETLILECADDFGASLENFWYYFRPSLPRCQALIQREEGEIARIKEHYAPRPSAQEIERKFIKVSMVVKKVFNVPSLVPPYEKLLTINRNDFSIYLINGVDISSKRADDRFGIEYMRTLQALVQDYGPMRLIRSEPPIDPLAVKIKDTPLENVSYEKIFAWIVDQKDYPPEISHDSQAINQFRSQIMSKFVEKRFMWQFLSDGKKNHGPIYFHTFYGGENGAIVDIFQEALSFGDIVVYNGHSHLGQAGIHAANFIQKTFASFYQILFINSCSSFGLFAEGLRDLKGAYGEMTIVANGFSSPIKYSGSVVANFLIGILRRKCWENILWSFHNVNSADQDPVRVIIE